MTKTKVWDLPVRVFHWTLAGAFTGAYLLAESERQRQIHVMFGYTVLGLVAFRLLWGFVGTRWARFSSFLYSPRSAVGYVQDLARGRAAEYTGHNPAGSYAIWAILGLAVATGITGWMNLNEIGGEAVEEIHELFANGWLVVVGVHIAGVIASSFAHRQNLARSMVTGYKETSSPGAVDSAPRGWVGAAVAVAVFGFWTFWLVGGGQPAAGYGQAEVAQADHGDDDDDAD